MVVVVAVEGVLVVAVVAGDVGDDDEYVDGDGV